MNGPRKVNILETQAGRAVQKRVLVLSVTVLGLTHNRQRCAAKALHHDRKAVKEKLNPVLRSNAPACSDAHYSIDRAVRCLRKSRHAGTPFGITTTLSFQPLRSGLVVPALDLQTKESSRAT